MLAKKTNVNGWMLGKCCLFGVSDLFLTFPGILFNFKKSSTGSQTRNTVSNSQRKMITSTRNTSTSATSTSATSTSTSTSSSSST